MVAGVAVGVTFSAATGSPWALLTGLGVPALASRSLGYHTAERTLGENALHVVLRK